MTTAGLHSTKLRAPGAVCRLMTASMLLTVSSFAGCRSSADTEQPAAPPVQVRVAEAELRLLRPSFEVIGIVTAAPERQAILAAATPGLVKSLVVREGARVTKGDPVVLLDDRKARIDLDRAEAAYTRMVAKPRVEELTQAQALVEKAKAAHALAAKRLRRSEDLQKRSPELVPEVQLLDDRRVAEGALADLDTARAQLRLLELGPREEQRKEAYVEVEATKLQLEYCRVTAPFDGEVVELLARVGMKADVGTPVARVIDTSEVLVQARVPGNKLAAVAATVSVEGTESPTVVRSESFPGRTFTASSGMLGQQAEGLTGDIPVKIRVPNPDGLLRVGMSVQVELHEPAVTALAIPEAAVGVNEDGHKVVTVIRAERAVPTEIELSSDAEPEMRAAGWVRVIKGLRAHDMVAVQNGYALPLDTLVAVIPTDSPADSLNEGATR